MLSFFCLLLSIGFIKFTQGVEKSESVAVKFSQNLPVTNEENVLTKRKQVTDTRKIMHSQYTSLSLVHRMSADTITSSGRVHRRQTLLLWHRHCYIVGSFLGCPRLMSLNRVHRMSADTITSRGRFHRLGRDTVTSSGLSWYVHG